MICREHQTELLPSDDPKWRGKLLLCPVKGCSSHHVLIPRQAKLPGLDRGKQSKAVRVSEAALIKQGVQWAGYAGYEVLQIGQTVQYPKCPCCRNASRRIFCPSCGETYTPQLYSTNTEGTPDTFFSHRDWEPNTWKGIEWKASETAPVRTEQKRLIALGMAELAWSIEQLRHILE